MTDLDLSESTPGNGQVENRPQPEAAQPEPDMTRRISQSTRPHAEMLETIYKLAVEGLEFTAIEVMERSGLTAFDVVGRALKRAEMVGIVEAVKKDRRHRPQTKAEFLSGKQVEKVPVIVYRGQSRVRDQQEEEEKS